MGNNMGDSKWWLNNAVINLALAVLFCLIYGYKIFFQGDRELFALRVILILAFWLVSVFSFNKHIKLKKSGK